MEKKIIETLIKRNKILDELLQVNELAIARYQSLSTDDVEHFLLTRKYLIKSLSYKEDEVIAVSMMEWSSFKLDSSYKLEYIELNREKDEKLAILLRQDRALEVLMNELIEYKNIA